MPPPKRVILTLDALDARGVTFSTLNLIAGLLKRGTKILVMAGTGGAREEDFRAKGIKVIIARHFGQMLFGRTASTIAKTFNPALIHAQSPGVAPRSAALARQLSIPLMVTANRLEDSEGDFLTSELDAGVIAVSDVILERLTNRAGVMRKRIRVIPNGLDLTQFPPPNLDADQDLHARTPVVGTYGTLAEAKGQRVFLKAAATVLQSGIDAEFLILGEGPDKAELRRIAKSYGITSRLTFSPTTSGGARPMASMDLFVEPTFQEGLGLSVMQAMACGIPVVASGVGGIFSLIADGDSGVLVPRGEAEPLAEAIGALLAQPDRRRELARAARERIEKEFSSAHIADQVLAWYGEWIAAQA